VSVVHRELLYCLQALCDGVDVPLPPDGYTGPSPDSKRQHFSFAIVAVFHPLMAALVSKRFDMVGWVSGRASGM